MPNLTQKTKEEIMSISNPVVRLRWQKYYSIPKDLQDTLFDQIFADKIGEIIDEKYNLGGRNMTVVAKIIGLIFLGELPIKNFIVSLQNELKIDTETAKAIAQDINQDIFQPVRQSLMEVHGIVENTPVKENNSQKQQYQQTEQIKPVQNNDYEAQKRREEVLNKIKNQSPTQARPAVLRIMPNKNTVDLRTIKRRNENNEYNGFFSA